jgi:AraC-like DNA-binding protein
VPPEPDKTKHGYQPVLARTTTIHHPTGPVAYDCVKVVVVRDGSALLFSEFGEKPVTVGDVVTLGANTLCGTEPEDHITATTVYLDPDYMIDQVFWQHVGLLRDRLDAQDFAEAIYVEPAQILHVGEDRAGLLMPWLDELVALSIEGATPGRFYRMQALLFAVLDVLIPFVRTTPIRTSASQRARTIPSGPRLRKFLPLRAEATAARELLHHSPAEPWTLSALARRVHLSEKQLSRVFVEAYGKTPLAYLTMMRVEHMARLLRDGEMSVAAAGRAAGWASRSRAAEAFRQCVGVTPQQYRTRVRNPVRG